MDVEFMRRLHRKVNIVPVIAKADTLTKSEIGKLKTNILNDIETNKIKVKRERERGREVLRLPLHDRVKELCDYTDCVHSHYIIHQIHGGWVI